MSVPSASSFDRLEEVFVSAVGTVDVSIVAPVSEIRIDRLDHWAGFGNLKIGLIPALSTEVTRDVILAHGSIHLLTAICLIDLILRF